MFLEPKDRKGGGKFFSYWMFSKLGQEASLHLGTNPQGQQEGNFTRTRAVTWPPHLRRPLCDSALPP